MELLRHRLEFPSRFFDSGVRLPCHFHVKLADDRASFARVPRAKALGPTASTSVLINLSSVDILNIGFGLHQLLSSRLLHQLSIKSIPNVNMS